MSGLTEEERRIIERVRKYTDEQIRKADEIESQMLREATEVLRIRKEPATLPYSNSTSIVHTLSDINSICVLMRHGYSTLGDVLLFTYNDLEKFYELSIQKRKQILMDIESAKKKMNTEINNETEVSTTSLIQIEERELHVGDIVQHFKRELLSDLDKDKNVYLYKIFGIAEYTETNEKVVVYQSL